MSFVDPSLQNHAPFQRHHTFNVDETPCRNHGLHDVLKDEDSLLKPSTVLNTDGTTQMVTTKQRRRKCRICADARNNDDVCGSERILMTPIFTFVLLQRVL